MKLLFVMSSLAPCARSIATISRYVEAGQELGHEVAVFGEANPALPWLPFTTDVAKFDHAVFAIQSTRDFPEMPHLARLFDGIPAERRVVLDLWGRYNDTLVVENDFNHSEKVDQHRGWEWEDAFRAVSSTILQPALAPRRPDVRSFLFHAYDPAWVQRPGASAAEAVRAWQGGKPYGLVYVGSNWQRWDQLRRLFEHLVPVRQSLGRILLAGWAWDRRPEWAVQADLKGVDVDPAFLTSQHVETQGPVNSDAVVPLLGKARLSPVLHRPLFRHLGLVTNRTFETFCADTIPMLLLPADFVAAIYGPAAAALVPGEDVAAFVADVLRRPEYYWEAALATRAHLARRHSFAQRFQELQSILEDSSAAPPREDARP